MNKQKLTILISLICACSSSKIKRQVEYLEIENARQQREIQNLNYALTWMSNELRELNKEIIRK